MFLSAVQRFGTSAFNKYHQGSIKYFLFWFWEMCDVTYASLILNKSTALSSPYYFSFSHYLLSWKVNDGSECSFSVYARINKNPERLHVCSTPHGYHCVFEWLWSSTDFLVEKDNDYCVCQTPCNMTRYGKELSMVKIPSKASAKYLAKKFNKTEQYIG